MSLIAIRYCYNRYNSPYLKLSYLRKQSIPHLQHSHGDCRMNGCSYRQIISNNQMITAKSSQSLTDWGIYSNSMYERLWPKKRGWELGVQKDYAKRESLHYGIEEALTHQNSIFLTEWIITSANHNGKRKGEGRTEGGVGQREERGGRERVGSREGESRREGEGERREQGEMVEKG